VIARSTDYVEIHDFSEGLAAVRSLEERKWGFIDNSGNIVLPCIYEWVGESGFSDGLALVKDNNKWGFIDKSGNVAVRIGFDALFEFAGDFAVAVTDRKFGIIDKSGYEVIPCQYEFVGYIGYGRAFIRQGDIWGIIEISR